MELSSRQFVRQQHLRAWKYQIPMRAMNDGASMFERTNVRTNDTCIYWQQKLYCLHKKAIRLRKKLNYDDNHFDQSAECRSKIDKMANCSGFVATSEQNEQRKSSLCVCARDTHKMCAYPAYGQSNRIEVDGKSTWCNCRRTIMKAPNWSSTTETKGNAAELSIFGRNGLHGYGVHRNTILIMITLISRLIVLEAQHLNITFFCVCKTYVCGTMRTHTFFLTRFLLRFRQKRLNNRFEQLNWPKKNILENTRAHWKCMARRATNVI